MSKIEATQYHCCFLLDKGSSSLNMAIAWRRVGNYDYGVYLTRRQGQEENSPLCTLFRATYSPKGEIVSFFVKDGLLEVGRMWDDDHIDPGGRKIGVDIGDVGNIDTLACAFFGEWLEPYGATEASQVLKKMGLASMVEHVAWRDLLSSGLPAEVRRNRLPDVLSCAEATEQGFLYSFLPYPERIGVDEPTNALLEAKMRMFFELL